MRRLFSRNLLHLKSSITEVSNMIDIESLKPLPDFSWETATLRPQDKNYFDYYDINFSDTLPEVKEHHFGVKKLAGFSIAMHYVTVKKSRATIVLIHGYMDHVGLYNHIIKAMLQAGYNVLAFDLPGHGLSSGEQAGIPSFAVYQQVLAALMAEASDNLSQPWMVVGQSTGGLIAMDYLLNNDAHGFEKAVLMAPLVIPRKWFFIKLQLFLLGWLLNRVPREFVRNSSDDEFLYFLKHEDPLQTRWIATSWVRSLYYWQAHFEQCKISDTSIFVIQGENDVTVDWQYNLPRVAGKFSNYRELLLKKANHHLVKESEAIRTVIFTEILAFLDE